MLLWLLVICFLTRSNLQFPSRCSLPFGLSQIVFGLCFFPFSVAFLGWSPFGLSPLRSCVLFASGVLVCLFLLVGSFSLLLCLVRCCFLLGHFLFLLVSVAFALFGSSLLLFHGSCLRSLLPFSSQFLCYSLFLLPSVSGSLSPFLGRSSSLSPCFRLRLLRSVACPDLGLHSMAVPLVGSCPFSFSVCLSSAMRCFFVAFLPSGFLPSGTLFPLLLCLSFSSLQVSCFPLFPLFSVGLFFGSRLVCFTIGLLFSLLVPGSSFLLFSFFSLLFLIGTFVSALIQVVLFLVSCLCPSGSYPLDGVLCCFFCDAFSHFLVFRGFCASLASSFPVLPQFLRLSLASLSAFFQGCFFVSCLSLVFFSC